jgi:hypothetical protein
MALQKLRLRLEPRVAKIQEAWRCKCHRFELAIAAIFFIRLGASPHNFLDPYYSARWTL